MNIYIIALIIIGILLYIGGFNISFIPFRMELPNWRISLSAILLWIAFSLARSHIYKEGRISAFRDVIEIINESVK